MLLFLTLKYLLALFVSHYSSPVVTNHSFTKILNSNFFGYAKEKFLNQLIWYFRFDCMISYLIVKRFIHLTIVFKVGRILFVIKFEIRWNLTCLINQKRKRLIRKLRYLTFSFGSCVQLINDNYVLVFWNYCKIKL